MNWGYKILITYLVFVAGILFLCFKAGNEQFDLVEKNYYEAELKYQDRIDENNRTASLSEPVKILVENNQLNIIFPKEFNGVNINGEAVLYYAADAVKDLKQTFSIINGQYRFRLPASNKGFYTVKISWKAKDQNYYYEEKIFL